jgi:peptidoglycan/xylan/chitin deacetylase (PgdA/CDA1 family)
MDKSHLIALTFDDGPSESTPRLLALLDAVGAHATFFAVGERLAAFVDQARAVVAQGSALWGHGWDHRGLVGMPPTEVAAQLERTREAIERATGVRPLAFRPPYGAVDETVATCAGQVGQAIIVWSLDSGDWDHGDGPTTVARVLDGARDGAIVLCHETVSSTPDAMARVVPELIARGYELVTVADLLAANGASPQPGRVVRGPVTSGVTEPTDVVRKVSRQQEAPSHHD